MSVLRSTCLSVSKCFDGNCNPFHPLSSGKSHIEAERNCINAGRDYVKSNTFAITTLYDILTVNSVRLVFWPARFSCWPIKTSPASASLAPPHNLFPWHNAGTINSIHWQSPEDYEHQTCSYRQDAIQSTFAFHCSTQLSFEFFSNLVQSFLLFFQWFQLLTNVLRRVLKLLQN